MSRLLCLLKFKTLINLKTFTILAFLISHIGMLYFETWVGGICSCFTPLLEPELDTNPLLLCWSFVWNSECYVWLGCCKAAITFPSDSKCWLDLNQKTIFSNLIDKIYCDSGFLEALRLVKAVIQKKPFQLMRWLQLLNWEGEMIEEQCGDIPSVGFENSCSIFNQHKDKAKVAFMHIKSKFCCEVVFEHVIDSYGMVLEKYKKTRKQYMNGMLSQHCKGQ